MAPTIGRVRERSITLPADAGEGTEDGFVYVKRTRYDSGTPVESEESSDRIRVPALSEVLQGSPHARVRLSGGVTKNLGNYNSAKVEVMIDLPCLPESSEIERVVDMISAKLDVMVPKELDKATGGNSSGS